MVAGDDCAGPSGLCPGVGKAEGGPGVKSVERSILRQSRGIVKMKTTRDVSKLSLRCRLRVSVTRGANIKRDNVTKLRPGRSLSSQHLEKPEVVDLFDHEEVSKARRTPPSLRRRYASFKFQHLWILFVIVSAVAARHLQL